MISKHDIRIGSYYLDRAGKLLRCDFIENNKACMKMEVEGQEVHPLTEEFEYLQPMPLTNDAVEQLGFSHDKKWDQKGWVSKGLGSMHFQLDLTDDVPTLWFTSIFLKRFEYVHQLQNYIWARFGVNLEFKTPNFPA